jgi:hypothetical protein
MTFAGILRIGSEWRKAKIFAHLKMRKGALVAVGAYSGRFMPHVVLVRLLALFSNDAVFLSSFSITRFTSPPMRIAKPLTGR